MAILSIVRQKTVVKKLSQSVTEVYFKVHQVLQSASGVTRCVWLILQSASGITKYDSYYKVRHSSLKKISKNSQTSGHLSLLKISTPLLTTLRYTSMFVLCLHAIAISATIQNNVFSKSCSLNLLMHKVQFSRLSLCLTLSQ